MVHPDSCDPTADLTSLCHNHMIRSDHGHAARIDLPNIRTMGDAARLRCPNSLIGLEGDKASRCPNQGSGTALADVQWRRALLTTLISAILKRWTTKPAARSPALSSCHHLHRPTVLR